MVSETKELKAKPKIKLSISLIRSVRAAGCEVHFFDRHYPFGLNWYRKKMPPTITGQLTMEKTPSYFVTSSVPARVHKMNPKIK